MAASRAVSAGFAVAFALFAPLNSSLARELGDQLCQDVTLSEEEKTLLEPVLARYYAQEGSKTVLSSLISKCAAVGCRGNCMSDMVDLVSRTMKGGQSCDSSGKTVGDALDSVGQYCAERKIVPRPEEISRAVCTKVEVRLKEREGAAFFLDDSPFCK